MAIDAALVAGHGVISWRKLAALGMTRTQLEKAVAGGWLRPVRRGWYATGWADERVVRAVHAGGVASCVLALRLHGVWVPPFTGVHARARATANRAEGAGRFCRQYGRPEPETVAVDDVPMALRHAVRCLDAEGLVVVCDSIVQQRLMTMEDIHHELRHAPKRIQRVLDKCDRAESGTETMARLRLRSAGVRLRVQVEIADVGRVDFLIGDRLIVEVDGYEYHANPESFESDRERDRKAIELGYLVIRISYRQAMYRWDEAQESIMTVIRRREHLRKRPA